MGNVAGTCSDALGEVCTVGEEKFDRAIKTAKKKGMAQRFKIISPYTQMIGHLTDMFNCTAIVAGRNDIPVVEAGVVLPDDVVQSLKATRSASVELEVPAPRSCRKRKCLLSADNFHSAHPSVAQHLPSKAACDVFSHHRYLEIA